MYKTEKQEIHMLNRTQITKNRNAKLQISLQRPLENIPGKSAKYQQFWFLSQKLIE